MTYLLSWNGHSKMKRKDMWDWCVESKPDEAQIEAVIEENQDPKTNYHYYAAVRAVVNHGNLIIGIYDADSEPGKVLGCYYMTPCGNHHATKNGESWYQDKVMYLPIGGYSYYKDPGRVKWCWVDGQDDADAWINENELDDCMYGTIRNTLRRLDRIEAELSTIRRRNARERREQRISDWVHEIAYVPDGFEEWVEKTVFDDRHFAFWDKTEGKHSTRYHCTACGRVICGHGWKHGKEYECPLCAATVKVNKTRTWKDQTSRATFFYPCKNIRGRDRIAMITVYTTKRWRETGEITTRNPERILLIPMDGSGVDMDEIYYNSGCHTWSDRNSHGFRCAAGYLYLPNQTILRGTIYEDMLRPVAAAASRGWRLNYDYLMNKNGALKADLFEYLIKGGYRKMTEDLVNGRYIDGDIRWRGKTVDEVLQINGQSRARLRTADGNIKYLRWLQTAEVCGYKISDELIAWLAKNLSPTSVGGILNSSLLPRLSVEKIANYVRKQIKIGAPARNWFYGTKAEGLVQSWLDYLGMAKTLGLDLSRESVYKPSNLKDRHDELAEIIAFREREKQAKARAEELKKQAKDMEKKYPGVAPVCERIKKLYEWENEEYAVVVPSGAWDIMQEGVLLGHCSSRENENVYLERVEQETSYIMFLRKNKQKNAPWYTMEVEPGGNVIQLRTYGDDDGNHKYHDRGEAKAALNIWRKEIAKRLGQGEISKAQKSKEMLLKYWGDLQKNGNVIRGGYLKGSMLVDVLQADYKELNGELPKEEVG